MKTLKELISNQLEEYQPTATVVIATLKDVIALIDEIFKVKQEGNCRCCKVWLKELNELKERITGLKRSKKND